jgi:hypothetical protein
MNRAEAVSELKRVYFVLNSDVKEAQSATLANPSDFNKRTLIRTCAALVEGLAFQLRQVTLATLQGTEFLSQGDLSILREEKYQLSQQGNVEVRDNHQSTLAMILFTLRVYAKNHGATFNPDTSTNGWNCLRKAFSMRDQLMHPKSLQDLTITDEAGTEFSAGVQWWDEAIRDLFEACDEADKKISSLQSATS